MPCQPHDREGDGSHGRARAGETLSRELQAVERQRHPGRRVDLIEVTDMPEYHPAESVHESAERARDIRAGETPNEKTTGGARHHVRGNEEGVPIEAQ